MARDYPRLQELYLELQPYQHPQYELPHGPDTNSTPVYEVQNGASVGTPGAGRVVPAGGAESPAHSQPHHDPHSTKTTTYVADGYPVSGSAPPPPPPPPPPSRVLPPPQTQPQLPPPASVSRKRKPSSYGTGSVYDDDEDARSSRSAPDKKQNHSEIEKRRRDKMNTYITELSSMIPMCGAMARKLDKLTVLRMAVQHLRSVRGALAAGPLAARPRPSYLSERELNALVLHAAHDAFLLVVGCDRGRLLYVSASVSRTLHYRQSELLGQSLFDILHPKDVAKVKEQLSSSDLSPRERLIDAKTMLPVKSDVLAGVGGVCGAAGASRLCPGARRSFFCRIKCRAPVEALSPDPDLPTLVKEEGKVRKKQIHDKKYCVVQCTGYLKSWAPVEMSEGACCEGGAGGGEATVEGCEEGDGCNLSCLVAVGRALPDLAPIAPPTPAAPAHTRPLQYVSRHATDGKFLFVDQRVTLALGFLPQELLGTSVYEYVGAGELGSVARSHKAALLRRDATLTTPYAHRRKDGLYIMVQTHFKPFRNPWTKDVECLVANNTVVNEEVATHQHYDMFKQKSDVEMQRLIDSQLESHKIGSAIADELLRRSSPAFSPDLPADLLQDSVFGSQTLLVDNILGVDNTFSQVRNNVSLSSAAESSASPQMSGECGTGTDGADAGEGESVEGADGADNVDQCSAPSVSPPLPPLGLDGNGEAAMAVIMSLLEADAGLGGPVNFSGLPWPLP